MLGYQRSQRILSPYNSVLVLIELQERVLNAMSRKDEMVSNTLKLVHVAKIMGVPIIATEQNPERLGPTQQMILEALGDVRPISKMHFSCFGSDEFRRALEATGRKQVILTGLETHICVSQTVLDGEKKWEFFVAFDAVSSRTEENRLMGLERIREAGAVVGSAEMFIYEWLEKAGTDQFKAALKHIK